ncbi:MAG: hypothetical protein GXY48_04285 [Methanomicrobiales archaeon]|nr:hypothetical protein [Methanomicrobiales archaeon]
MNIPPENEKFCQICGKPAIGIEILGCCKQVVCEDHASSFLKNLSPGEHLNAEACYYVRY